MKDFNKYSKNNIYFYNTAAPKLLRTSLKKFSPRTIADFGCGDGTFLLDLYRRGLVDKEKEVFGIDLSDTRLKRVKKILPTVKTINSTAEKVSTLQINSIDYAICSQVIEHVADDILLLTEINSKMKKNALLYISSVVKSKYAWWIYKCNGKVTCDPTHLREYSSEAEFCDLIRSQGFAILSYKSETFKPAPFNFLRRFLLEKGVVSEKTVRSNLVLNLLSKLKLPVFGYKIVEVLALKIK